MSMRNKLIAALLACLLLFGSALSVGAAETPIFGSAAWIEEQIHVTVSVGSGVESGSFTLTYDTGLTLVQTESPMSTQDLNTSEAGKVHFAWAEKTENTAVLELTFSGAQRGSYHFVVEQLLAWNDSFQPVEAEGFTISIAIPCDGQERCPSAAFTDVDQSKWYHEAVDYVLENGIMEGIGSGKFAPDITLTRAMMVKILGSAAGIDPAQYAASSFDDVKSSAWYGPYVEWACQAGLVQGVGNGLFMPNAQITRQEMATILYRYWKTQGNAWTVDDTTYEAFADIDQVSSWAREAMVWATGMGLMDGVGDNLLAPRGTATRAQAAKLIMLYERL